MAHLDSLLSRRHPGRTGRETNLSLHFLQRKIEWSNLTFLWPQLNHGPLHGRLYGLGSLPGLVAKVLDYRYPTRMMATVWHELSLVHKLKRGPRHDRSSNPPMPAQTDAQMRSTSRLVLLPPGETISWIRTLVLCGPCPLRLQLTLNPTPPPHRPPQTMVNLNYPLPPQHPPPMRKWTRTRAPLTTQKGRGRIK